MVEWGWERSRFTYIPNFVDAGNFQANYQPGRAFVYFGRLGHEKGIATLIRAAALVDLPLHIIGVGPEEKALKELSSQLGATVRFFGYLQGEQLHDIIRSARAVVLPSEWYENAPLSVLEAYALGKPVIGASIGGIPELIREQETGFTFESGSEDKLAEILRLVAGLADAKLTKMGRAGREWVEEEFSVNNYINRLIELYRDLGMRTGQIR